jgi:DNA excision repair protein ERCC-3
LGANQLDWQRHGTFLQINDPALIPRFQHDPTCAEFFDIPTANGWHINPLLRGALKQAFWRKGWPVDDQATIIDGQAFDCTWRNRIALRPYQQAAVTACVNHNHGVIALPPGSGKTYIGVAVLAHIQRATLIITTSRAAAQQWRDSVLVATTCTPDDVAIYRGTVATLAPITITTYQQLIARASISTEADWGLILYDEVHTLPAPVFRSTALLNSRRRYGLSATLIREDGRIGDVFQFAWSHCATVCRGANSNNKALLPRHRASKYGSHSPQPSAPATSGRCSRQQGSLSSPS